MRFKVIPILVTVFWLAAVQAESQVGSPVLEEKYRQAMALMAAFQFDQAQALLSDCYHHEPENADYLLKIALRQYEQYLATGHNEYRGVAADRMRQLKEQLFFSK
ncbi:MAG TPA: hypothetical protein PKE06_02775 [Flavilitoribacter sp.]|nr:hypothetical protein [Flavilitoribacter sp.]HMQ86932.1 hypothetical protein [Flavilitoribacter sp.]